MQVITDLYMLLTSLEEKVSNGSYVSYYNDYYVNSDICTTIFVTGILVALALAAIFYFGIGNYVFKLAKRSVWAVVMGFVFVATFFISAPMIIGHDGGNAQESSGLYAASYSTCETKKSDKQDTESKQKEIKTAADYRRQYDESDIFNLNDDLPLEMAGATSVFAVLFFVLFSFGFKRFTTHATAIPI